MGRREATDCCKLIVMEYGAHVYQAVCTHCVQTHASVCFPKMHYVLMGSFARLPVSPESYPNSSITNIIRYDDHGDFLHET